ncbi:MAG: hypothetical protein ACYDH4_11775 [Candidatus Cryosericum sp.]
MSDNALVPVTFDQLPSTQLGTDDQFAALAKGGDYLSRMQLFTKGRAVNKGAILPGHYGIPEGDEEVTDLGVSVDLLPLARRPKAIDMSDSEALVISYDMASDEFQRIAKSADTPDSHCQFGPSFLVYERSTGRFLEFFCGNKSNRVEAKKIFPYLPTSQAQIDAKAVAGNDVTGLTPHGPLPITLKVKVAENKKGSWHVPVVVKCTTPFTGVSEEVMVREVYKFLTIKDNGVERVTEAKPARAR